jgi:thiol-disulfide isomerase/thioredoxin
LIGKPAPELGDVVGWEGSPVKLADPKGQVVILWFWTHHDPQSREQAPLLRDAVAKYADKGVRVVMVHIDRSGQIETAAKLDEKLAKIKHLGDIPFPVALTLGDEKYDIPSLTSKSRSRVAADYGLEYWPRGDLIDRQGIVRGEFRPNVARDVELLDKLLAEK